MSTLVCPQPRALRNPYRNQRATEFSLLFLVALIAITTGCASMNAVGSGSGTIQAPQPIAIAAHLPAATVGSAYNAVISVNGGTAPYAFAIRGGKLPPGLTINSASGAISGQPNLAGSYAFMVSVTDNAHTATGLRRLAITVNQPSAAQPVVEVAISPASLTLAPGAAYQFIAQVSHAKSPQVIWSASAGAITATGLFTAPNANAPATVQLIATSKADPSKRGIASVSVSVPTTSANLTMADTSLPDAIEGTPYSATLHLAGGIAPYHWKIASGALPVGFAFDLTEGTINGITSQNGPFPLTIAAGDASGQSISRTFALNVSPANTGNVDGPAELPRLYVKSSLADTPAPGATRTVKNQATLQAALDSAKCGDTILLQAGTTFDGTVVLPAKTCDDAHWIVLRTSAPDSALPPEGTRLTPCYAGVTSLPGRPPLGCSSPKNVLATIAFSSSGSGPIVMADGANHYRLIGLEITRNTPKAIVYNLVVNEHGGTSDHIVIDRSWLHGTAQDETTRGLMLTGSTYVAVVDSFFTDFHCVAISGTCGDSQAIGGGLGTQSMGPYKIVNNFLEAAGENILFGGGAADHTPEDIEIRRNHLYKPTIWMQGQPGYVGGRDGHPFIVKNHFELKNGIRVLFEGNVLENTWGGFTQAGFGVLLTPKNQNGLCPLCVVHDVTIRYTTISHVASGFQIGNGASDSGALSLGMWNVSIHDVVVTDINGSVYNGAGLLLQESNGNHISVLHDVVINHVTALNNGPKSVMMVVGNKKSDPEMYGFVWSNNIFSGGFGINTTGGGAANCAFHQKSAGVLANCFKQSQFSHNALIGTAETWPPENFAPASIAEVKFATSGNEALARYQLQSSSPYAHAATDGKSLGADVEALSAAVAGVQ
jgi:Putative Ig domain